MIHTKHVMYEGHPHVVVYIEHINNADVLAGNIPGEHIGEELFYAIPEHDYKKLIKDFQEMHVDFKTLIINYASFYKTSRETAKRLFESPFTPGKSGFKNEEWANREYLCPIP